MDAATMMMRSTVDGLMLRAPAKVNLFLEILGKRADGFHELETVMATVNLYDELFFQRREDSEFTLRIVTSDTESIIPTDERNLVIRSLLALRKQDPERCRQGFSILLKKRIPSEAGLGGASADAAAAILAGNHLWQLNLSRDQLANVASEIGSDVPFFLFGGTAICKGRGERIRPIAGRIGLPMVIGKPATGLSTADVYQKLRLPAEQRLSQPLVSELECGSVTQVASTLFNRLQEVASLLSDEVGEMAMEFDRINCPGHLLTGSGTAYYGVFPTPKVARRAAKTLSNRVPRGRFFYCQAIGPNLELAT